MPFSLLSLLLLFFFFFLFTLLFLLFVNEFFTTERWIMIFLSFHRSLENTYYATITPIIQEIKVYITATTLHNPLDRRSVLHISRTCTYSFEPVSSLFRIGRYSKQSEWNIPMQIHVCTTIR